MARYHISPKTGNPNVCKAKEYCPFAPPSEHYSSREEAREAYEQGMAKHALKKLSKKPEVTLLPTTFRSSLAPMPTKGSAEYRKFLAMPSGVACGYCGEPLTQEQHGVVISYHDITRCTVCGKALAIADVYAPNNASYSDLEADTNNCKKRVWFHATEAGEDWQQQLLTNEVPTVHLGSPQAALDRLLTHAGPSASGELAYSVYQVELEEDCTVDDSIEDDEDTWDYEEGVTSDVHLYRNIWEDPGSISLAVNTKKLRVVGREVCTAEEARALRSTYNLSLGEEAPNNFNLSNLEEDTFERFLEEKQARRELELDRMRELEAQALREGKK